MILPHFEEERESMSTLLGLLHMTVKDVADYMNELTDDLNRGSISQDYYEKESAIVEQHYPSEYLNWVK